MNHYKGDEVLQNFGYIKIGTKWADPDSEYDLYRAIQLHEYGNDLYTPRQQPISPPHVPVPEQPWTSLRPRIMSPEEEDEFYADYIKEVTDDQDGEGDPRQYRISPATFARWAGGAASGEHFHEQPSMPSVSLLNHLIKLRQTNPRLKLKLPPPDRDYEDQIVARPRPDPHFDVDTGSVLSGVYETDPDPRVLQTPQGTLLLIVNPSLLVFL